MGYRKTLTEIWSDEWFENLSPNGKLLFLYLFTNNICNPSGIYRINQRRIKFETGIKELNFEEIKDKVLFDNGIVWIKNFFKHQCQNKDFAKKALEILKEDYPQFYNLWTKYNQNTLKKYNIEVEPINNLPSTPLEGSLNPPSIHIEDTTKHPSTPLEHNTVLFCSVNNTPKNELKENTDRNNQPRLNESIEEKGEEKKEEENSQKKAEEKKDTDNCPHQKIIELYHELLPSLPRVKIWGEKQKRALRARWREDAERQNLGWWQNYFEHIRASPFLMGQKTDFIADLEWLINSSNMTKVLNGRYHRSHDRPKEDDYPIDIQ